MFCLQILFIRKVGGYDMVRSKLERKFKLNLLTQISKTCPTKKNSYKLSTSCLQNNPALWLTMLVLTGLPASKSLQTFYRLPR